MSGSLPEIPANAEGLDPRLSPEQRSLYRYAERWLAQNRHLAPGNDSVTLLNPRPSYGGITCDVVRVTCISQELFALFQNLSPDSTPVTGTMDEETGKNLYRVTIPFLEIASEKYAESFLTRFFNEPAWIIYGLSALSITATLTTSREQWIGLAAVVLGLK